MNYHADKKLKTLKVIQRKEEWDLDSTLTSTNQAKQLLNKLTLAHMNIRDEIFSLENQIRAYGSGEVPLAMDEMQRLRAFVEQRRYEQNRVQQEESKAQKIVDEYSQRLVDSKARVRAYETLADKRRFVLMLEEGRREARQMDELWLQSKGNKV